MLIDHTNRRVLEVLENRDKASVVAYLQAGKASGLFAQLEEVVTIYRLGKVANRVPTVSLACRPPSIQTTALPSAATIG